MTRVILRALVSSQRIAVVVLLTMGVAGLVASNRPQAPGAALAAALLLMLPVHAWIAVTAATGTDVATREAWVAAIGPRRVMNGHILAATAVGAVADLAVVAWAAATQVMSPQPTLARWAAGALVGAVGLLLGVAIGTLAGPPLINRRGTRIVVLVWLLVLAPVTLPLLHLARALDESSSSDVLAAVAAPAAISGLLAIAVLAGSLHVAARRL